MYRDVEFQGCGVPSAFADPGAFESSDDTDVAAEEDRLTDLPKLPLQMRTSGLRVSTISMPMPFSPYQEDTSSAFMLHWHRRRGHWQSCKQSPCT